MPGEYATKSRKYLIEYFKLHSEKMISASQINDYLKENNKPVNLATIYRNLDKLTEDGILLKYKNANEDRTSYQYVGESEKCHNHLHMQCENCGKIIHLDCDFMQNIQKHLLEEHSFSLECSNSVLRGFCKQCKKDK